MSLAQGRPRKQVLVSFHMLPRVSSGVDLDRLRAHSGFREQDVSEPVAFVTVARPLPFMDPILDVVISLASADASSDAERGT